MQDKPDDVNILADIEHIASGEHDVDVLQLDLDDDVNQKLCENLQYC